MNHCLSEPALLRVCMDEGTAAEQWHVRSCRECARRHARLSDDLGAIRRVLVDSPLPVVQTRHPLPRPGRWMAAAAACAALLLWGVRVVRVHDGASAPAAAPAGSFAAFADDLSAALFESDTSRFSQAALDAPYVEAALTAGQPCTRDGFFSGECNDQLSAFASEEE